MDANASDGAAIQFGSIVNTNADAHELNDSVALSTPVPQPRAELVGSMDSAQDIDYFHFVAQYGQDLEIELKDAYGQDEWIIEYFTGTSWAVLDLDTAYRLSGLPMDFMLHVRVYPNPAVAVNPAHQYELTLGSIIAASTDDEVGSDENLVRLGNYDWDPYLTTQVHNELSWSIRIMDPTLHPLEGVTVKFLYGTQSIPATVDIAETNVNGVASGSIPLPDCIGDNTVVHTAPNGQTWETDFDEGRWRVEVPEAFNLGDVGVGGENFPYVVLGHICDQTYLDRY